MIKTGVVAVNVMIFCMFPHKPLCHDRYEVRESPENIFVLAEAQPVSNCFTRTRVELVYGGEKIGNRRSITTYLVFSDWPRSWTWSSERCASFCGSHSCKVGKEILAYVFSLEGSPRANQKSRSLSFSA